MDEGVVKFQIDLIAGPAPDWPEIAELDAWRTILFRLGLIGQDPRRYGGLAYGNVSLRDREVRFIVSGTQTGALEIFKPDHYVRVIDFDIAANRIGAYGPIAPSSEALTHAAVYQHASWVKSVLHVHSPDLWRLAARLGLPETPRHIGYGTPAMADAVGAILQNGGQRVISMGGHEDGIIAVGESPAAAAHCLMDRLADGLRLRRLIA